MKKILTLMAVSCALCGSVAVAQLTPARVSSAGFSAPLGQPADSSASVSERGKAMRSLAKKRPAPNAIIDRRDASAQPEPDLKIWASVSYSDHDESAGMNAHRGFYLIDGQGKFTKLDANAVNVSPNSSWGTTFVGDDCYVGGSSRIFDVWSTDTWTKTGSLPQLPAADCSVSCSAYYAPEGMIYGCRANTASATGYEMIAYSVSPYYRKVVAYPTTYWSAMAMTPEGLIYGLDNVGTLWKCTRSGEITKIADSVIPCEMPSYYGAGTAALLDKDGQSMLVNVYGINPDLPGADNDYSGALYRVNLASGASTLIVHFTYNDNIKAMRFPRGFVAGVPEKITGLNLDFTGKSLSGNVGFTLPSATTDGSTPTGDLTWRVYVNGEKVSEGTGAWGSTVSAPVTAPAGGVNYIYAECASASGTSVGAGDWKFIGSDVPMAPTNVTAKFYGSQVMVTWNKVTEAVNGGYINPDEVTYTLRCYAGPDDTEGTIWKENISICSEMRYFPEPDKMTDFHWGVTASYDDKTSAEGVSNSLRTGSVVPEWFYGFEDQNDIFNLFSTVNNNSDYAAASQWKYTYSGYGTNKNGMVQVQINTSQAPDEDWDKWLISPNLKLTPGKVYEFTIKSKAYRANATNPQKFEVMLGTSATDMDQMTKTIIPVSDVATTNFETYKGYLSVNQEGKYYIGVHVCTPCEPATTRNLYFDDFYIGLPQETSAPGQPTEVSIVPDPTGAHNVLISCNAPALDYAGTNALQSLDKVEVLRDDEMIHTFNHPDFGEALSFTDTDVELGNHTYTLVGYNENGKGNSVSSTVFVGVKLPGAPQVFSAQNTDVPTQVKLTWDPVTLDEDGEPLPAGGIKSYSIIELIGNSQKWLKDVDGLQTEVTIEAIGEDEDQDFKMYALFAETESGIGRGRASAPVLVGKPDQLPWTESFDDAYFHHNYMVSGVGAGNWYLLTDTSIGVTDADGNNGFAAMQASNVGDCKSLTTGRIDLTASTQPRLTFQTYNIASETIDKDLNEFDVFVVESDDVETQVKHIVLGEDCPLEGWNRFLVDLSQWSGKNIQLRFQATAQNFQYTMLDAVKVSEAYEHDLTAVTISAPTKIRPNEEFKVRVKLENSGANTEMDYDVELYANGEMVASMPGRTVHPAEMIWVDVPATLNIFTEGVQEFTALIVLESDGNQADNQTTTTTARVVLPTLPVVNDPIAQADESGYVEVRWSAPTIERTPTAVTDDFEDCEGGSSDLDNWTFIDGDDLRITGFEGFSMPGATSGCKRSWFVLDNADPAFSNINSFYSNSGSKCLVQMGVEGQAIDWIISPKLSGEAQTVSFWTRCYYPGTTETIEFLVSGRSDSTYDFSRMATYDVFNHEWTQYMVNVPAGAQYFAIKATTYNGIMAMIDDITYTPLGHTQVNHLGYNIYRDGEKLNESLLVTPDFNEVHPEDPVGKSYHITSVYDAGESLPVEVKVETGLGVNGAAGAAVAVNGGKGQITVAGAYGLPMSVYAADGMVILTVDSLNSDYEVVPVNAAGIYIVRIGNESFKILVD